MTQKSVEITRKGAQHSFSHPDCDRRYRNFTGSCGKSRLRTVTAGGELRPASKTDDSVDGMIILRAAQKSTGNFKRAVIYVTLLFSSIPRQGENRGYSDA